MTRSRIVLCSAAALLLALPELRAAPLEADTCNKLDAERLQLEFAGARANLAKGPEWAKSAKLSTEALNQVRRLIDVDAQLLFRCSGGGLVSLPTDLPDPDPAAALQFGEDGKETPEQAAPPKAPAAKAKPDPAKKAATTPPPKASDPKGPPAKKGEAAEPAKKAPADKAKAPANKAKAEKAAAPQAKAPAPQPKPKTDDAYKPPPAANPNADPFTGKAAPPAK
jgi:hypothetical protein